MDEAALKSLQLRLLRQLDAAVQAADDFDRARSQLGLPPYLPVNLRTSLREATHYASGAHPADAADTVGFILDAASVRRGQAATMEEAERRRKMFNVVDKRK